MVYWSVIVKMMKTLGKIGIGKSKSASEDQISKHKSMVLQHKQWSGQYSEIKSIVKKLEDTYASTKTEFALSRYEELKTMIKSAVHNYRNLDDNVKKGSFKYRPPSGDSAGSSESGRKVGAITKLRLHAQAFSSSNEDLQQQEKDYSKMTSKEVLGETEEMRKEIIQLKQDYYTNRDRLIKLASDYEESKKYDPTKRYNVLKQLIKDATRTV